MKNSREFFERIEELRKLKKLPLSELGFLSGISEAEIKDWAKETSVIDAEDVFYVAKTLETTVEYLITGKEIDASEITNIEKEQLKAKNAELNAQISSLSSALKDISKTVDSVKNKISL